MHRSHSQFAQRSRIDVKLSAGRVVEQPEHGGVMRVGDERGGLGGVSAMRPIRRNNKEVLE
jgi:hypothetical protein